MIFTHIFRYLDDRDAEEIRRRSSDNSVNSRSPVADSRCQEFPAAEQREMKFGKNTWKGAPVLVPGGTQTSIRSKTLSSASLSQGFSTLRAETRRAPGAPKTTTANRILPPIGKSQMTGEEKPFAAYEKNTAKLPPIEPLTSKPRSATMKPRSCSKKDEETFWKSTPSEEKKERQRRQPSFDDMSLAKAGIKKTLYQQNAKKLDGKTTKVVESTQPDAINAEKTGNYLISRQFETHKGFSDRVESFEQRNKPKTGELYKSLGVSEYNEQARGLSVASSMEALKTRSNSSPCVPSAEYLRSQANEASSNHVYGSLVTNSQKETKLHLVACDKGRRNAICEVLEKTTVPEYGSSLYEMRQNLMSIS